MSATSNFINLLAKKYAFRRYLEIGVRAGATFCNVTMPHKTAVDPDFTFDTKTHSSEIISYYSEYSDDFFERLPERLQEKPFKNFNFKKDFKFDIVYIDGMHTFEQSYKDFRNVLPYIHDRSIIIFDDTLPKDPWSAINNQEKSLFYRAMANIAGNAWNGDVYKTIFTIHDFHPEFCYATNISSVHPQTVLWKNSKDVARERVFASMVKIMSLSYFDMLDNARLLVPLPVEAIIPLIYTYIDINDYAARLDYTKIISPFTLAT